MLVAGQSAASAAWVSSVPAVSQSPSVSSACDPPVTGLDAIGLAQTAARPQLAQENS